MKRAIRKFVGSLTGTKKYIFFIVLALVCIVALCLGIYAQFFYKYAETDALMIGINISAQKNAEEIEKLKSEFNNIFNNSIIINSENVRTDKIDSNKELVYSGYSLVNEDENYYSVNAQIPIINIDTEKAKEINSEIRSEFYEKANNIMRRSEGYTLYTVNYAAFVDKDVLSVVIKSSLKEENKSEKVSIKTYNYSIPEGKLVSLSKLIEMKEKTNEEVQKIINNDIKTAYDKAKVIAVEYGNLYERDLSSDIYKVENATTFFINQSGDVYIVYAYGNKDYTNEMDVIIF